MAEKKQLSPYTTKVLEAMKQPPTFDVGQVLLHRAIGYQALMLLPDEKIDALIEAVARGRKSSFNERDLGWRREMKAKDAIEALINPKPEKKGHKK